MRSDAPSSGAAPDGASTANDEPAAPIDLPSSWSRLRRRLIVAVARHLPDSPSDASSIDPPPPQTGGYARWLPVLRALPWLLLGAFALSFVWDFPGVALSVGGYTLPLNDLLRFTTVGGLIGFGTNWLAITMLFRPRERRPIWGQGLVPSQRERVAYRLAEAVSDELINKRIIMQRVRESGLTARYRDLIVALASDVVTDDDVRREGKRLLRRALQQALAAPEVQERIAAFTAEQMNRHAEGLSGLALRTYRLFGEEDFQSRLREAVRDLPKATDALLDELDPLLDRVPAALERNREAIDTLLTELLLRLIDTLDVERIVYENVRAYDERQLELLLRRTTNEQLNYIKYLGAVLGVLGGLIIWAPALSLVVLTSLGLLLYAVDEVLYRLRFAPDAS